jgi:hypothetical protein
MKNFPKHKKNFFPPSPHPPAPSDSSVCHDSSWKIHLKKHETRSNSFSNCRVCVERARSCLFHNKQLKAPKHAARLEWSRVESSRPHNGGAEESNKFPNGHFSILLHPRPPDQDRRSQVFRRKIISRRPSEREGNWKLLKVWICI